MRVGKLIFLCFYLAFLGFNQNLIAQNSYRVPFKHRIGSTSVPNNILQIQGDFTIIGNTNLTLKNYSDQTENSLQEMVFVDIDGVPGTFNSSSSTLLFSEENGADPNCTDVIYAGLYWSGRVQTPGITFELSKEEGFLDPVTLTAKKDTIRPGKELEYFPYQVFISVVFDLAGKPFPQYEIVSNDGKNWLLIRFNNDKSIEYDFNQSGWTSVEDIQTNESNGMVTATFKPIPFSDNGINFSISGLIRSFDTDYNEFITSDNSILLESSGTYTPPAVYTQQFDKRKLKLKPPGASDYQEITSAGNAILFPEQDLRDIYVGYADVTDLVREYGSGEYTVADIALTEGISDETGMFGNWGLIVVYQNPAMDFRNVTIFDGYTFIQSLDQTEVIGELEINGFGTIEDGPVNLKLGIMASEGDKSIGGDFLEILDQKGNWTRLNHPENSTDNFFNSSIYTPVLSGNGDLIKNQRTPNLNNNTGIDLIQWDVPNPDNYLISNNQTSVKLRYGTNQDLFALYVLAFSVSSYSPNIEAQNKIELINGAPPAGESSTVKPGEEITLQVDLRNVGTEATEKNKITIPIPYNALFVSAEIIPNNFGTVVFDPDLGVAGSIIWDIGNIPITTSINEIFASLRYTLKITEDCFFLANDNCDSMLSVDGVMTGIGSISKRSFSGIPFIKAYNNETCQGSSVYGPIEIPLSGKAEFVALNCPDFKLSTDLNLDQIPIFCHRDPQTTNLADLVKPSKDGYMVYFFSEETGGTPLINYYVNTEVIGTEKLWVSEGPIGSCTGMRIPLELKVIPTSPQIETENIILCQEATPTPFTLQPTPGYSLIYYSDNNPSSSPLSSPPQIDLSIPTRFSVWVSQWREGECESARKEVSFYIEDCALIPEIELTVTSNIDRYTQIGEEIIFTIVVRNPGEIPLFNVYLYESLQLGTWNISELASNEERSFEVRYVTTELDLANLQVELLAQVSGSDWKGSLVSASDSKSVFAVNYAPGFLDYTLSSKKATCESEGTGKGEIIISWTQEQEGTYLLTNLETGELEQVVAFFPRTELIIEAPAGSYSLEILDWSANSHKIDLVTIEGKEEITFDVPESIKACEYYLWIPEENLKIDLILTAPDGSRIAQGSDGSFRLVQTGEYLVRASHVDEEFCPAEKTFEAEITQAEEVQIDIRPFCSDDSSTTVDLIGDSNGLSIRWFQNGSEEKELDVFENSNQLIVSEEGSYQVTLRNAEGCLIGRRDFEIRKSITAPPIVDSLYSFCSSKNNWVEIQAEDSFLEFSWRLDGEELGRERNFIPNQAGIYQLETKDSFGCSFLSEFEVEEKCEPEVKFPNAIMPNDPTKLFEIYPDNLVDEIEVRIFNRWGQLIYHCEDKAPVNEVKSSCVWNGTHDGESIPNGTYTAVIQIKNYMLNETKSIRTSILVIK